MLLFKGDLVIKFITIILLLDINLLIKLNSFEFSENNLKLTRFTI